MRLLWWREALESAVSGHPLLAEVTSLEPLGVTRADLAGMVDGWEELLEPLPLPEVVLDRYAAARGTQLFTLSARILGEVATPAAGAAWALADFAVRCSDSVTAARGFDLASAKLEAADVRSLPRPLRILARLATIDVKRRARAPRTRWQMLRALA